MVSIVGLFSKVDDQTSVEHGLQIYAKIPQSIVIIEIIIVNNHEHTIIVMQNNYDLNS